MKYAWLTIIFSKVSSNAFMSKPIDVLFSIVLFITLFGLLPGSIAVVYHEVDWRGIKRVDRIHLVRPVVYIVIIATILFTAEI